MVADITYSSFGFYRFQHFAAIIYRLIPFRLKGSDKPEKHEAALKNMYYETGNNGMP
jgi:hypothetical protein